MSANYSSDLNSGDQRKNFQPEENEVNWFHSLQFRLPFKGGVIFIISVICFLLILIFVVKEQIIQSEKQLLSQIGQSLVSDINLITQSTETLTMSIAGISESLPRNIKLFHQVIPAAIDQTGLREIVAGGGIWPEKFQFDGETERRSFFWARNDNNELEYLDDYNDVEYSGYHHKEWYVPVKSMPRDRCYWSESYSDPYSFEPMVTCSVPMNNSKSGFSGVATVDIKLSGLNKLVEKISQFTEGYAFIVDRNNKFLSYPDLSKVKVSIVNQLGERSERFLDIDSFSQSYPEYNRIAQALEQINHELTNSVPQNKAEVQALKQELISNIHWEDDEEVALLAATLFNNERSTFRQKKFTRTFHIEKDVILDEPAFVQTFLIPNTYWKLVLITPETAYNDKVNSLVEQVSYYLITVVIFIFSLGYWLIGRAVIQPFYSLVDP